MRLIVLLLIVMTGFALRADYAWQGSNEDLSDSAAYERIARGLYEDGRFEQAGPGTPANPQSASNYSPGLPLLTAAVFVLAGDDDVRLARVVLALIASLAIVFSYLIATRLAGPGAGLVAAAALALYPTLITDSGMLLTESLAGTFLSGCFLAILRARDQSGRLAWALAGVMLGLTIMVRPEYLIVGCFLLLALVAIEAKGGIGHAVRPVAVLAVSALAVLAPWTVHNIVKLDQVVPISTGGGQTLFSGSYINSQGNPTRVMPDLLAANPLLLEELERQNQLSGEGLDSITPERVFALYAKETYPDLETGAALSRLGREQYLDALRDDPAGLADYFYRKAVRIWWRGRSGFIETIPGRSFHWAIVISALGGLILLGVRRRPEFWILAAIIVSVTLVGVLLVASPRRAMVLWPLISVLAGIGLTGAFGLARRELQRR